MDYYAKKKRVNNILLVIIILIILLIVIIILSRSIILKNKNLPKNDELSINQNYQEYDEILGCNYYKKNNQYYFMLHDPFNPIVKILPSSVDKFSFKPLDPIYAKDKNFVYYKGQVIENVDPKLFSVIYSKNFAGCSKKLTAEVDKATGLAKDNNYIYRNGQIEPKIDISTLEFLENNYIKTKDGVYVLPSSPSDNIRRLELAESDSFVVVQYNNYDSYLKSKYDAFDRNYYYKKGIIINQVDFVNQN